MKVFAIAVLGLVLATSGASFAATCVIDGIGGYASTQTIGPGNPFTTPCGHSFTGSGGNCTINLAVDDSVSTASGGCVTLQGQTILNMNSHTLTCTAGSSCGSAIATSDGASGSNKVVGPGT